VVYLKVILKRFEDNYAVCEKDGIRLHFISKQYRIMYKKVIVKNIIKEYNLFK
jgi:hypothetical protein